MQDSRDEQLHRNQAFSPSHQPLKHSPAPWLEAKRITGPISFLNPTNARFRPTGDPGKHTGSSSPQGEQLPPAVSFKWTSRNNRKGRHALAFPSSEAKHSTLGSTSPLQETARGIWRMFSVFPVWDISYDVATIFTLGSVVWVINAFFVWLPLVQPDTEFRNEILYGGGISAFIGATIFELGSFLLMAEAVNEDRTGCFGWALESVLSHDKESVSAAVRLRPSKSACTHHHVNKKNLVGKGRSDNSTTSHASASSSSSKHWTWFPSKSELRTHYAHDLGFLASFAQLIGATIFWISGFTALPGIYNHMSPTVTIIVYWSCQVIGGTGFIVSGTLFMLETQSKWYKPAFSTLGWWIGAWNLIGGIGFTLSAAFGYDGSSWSQFEACLATFWGSWAFLIGSVIQWYESLDKHPVEIETSQVGWQEAAYQE